MKFKEIAKLLNISETVVKSLCDKKVLPGCKCDEGWMATLEEIEHWYVRLSGKEWADLVYGGNVDPIMVEIKLEEVVTKAKLLNTLESLAEKGIIEIISHNFEDGNQYEFSLIFSQAIEKSRKGIKSLGKAKLMESIVDQIKLAYECEGIIGEHPIFATIVNNEVLRLSLKDKMEELPQRNREIIKFHLSYYALKLYDELL